MPKALLNKKTDQIKAIRKPKDKLIFKKNTVKLSVSKKKHTRKNLKIEIVGIEKTEYGMEVLARAWNSKGRQIGFSKDGTVDIEKFRFIMEDEDTELAWLVVPDPQGDISVDYTHKDIDGNSVTETKKYREDPQEHLLMFLERVIKSLNTHDNSKIVKEKRGNTVTVFTASSGGDGFVLNSGGSYTTVRNAATGATTNTTATDDWIFLGDIASGTYRITRAFLPFDTSVIVSSDNIDSAVLTIRQASNSGTGNRNIALIQTSQASISSLSNTDYDQITDTEGSATRQNLNTADTDYSWSLDATGKGWIAKDGEQKPSGKSAGWTHLGLRAAFEFDNPTTAPTVRNYTRITYADHATPANRPSLSVTHSAGSPPASFVPRVMMY